jgi:hypothetical protein
MRRMPRSTLTDNQFGFNPDSIRFVVGEWWLSRRPFCVEQTLPCALAIKLRRASASMGRDETDCHKAVVLEKWSCPR